MSGFLKNAVRRAVTSPAMYGRLRGALLRVQRLTGRFDEPDLRLLGRVPARADDLALDIGANGGQSAVALHALRPAARIISYEPIPLLWPELDRVGRMLGPRWEYRRWALGDAAGAMTLHVPVAGGLPITTRASLSADEARAHKAALEAEMGVPVSLETLTVEVRSGDSEGLSPSVVKIDVEGAERAVLDGFAETIAAARPVLLIERSGSYDACRRFFAGTGYAVLTHDGAGAGETRLPGLSPRNWIAAPPEALDALLRGA